YCKLILKLALKKYHSPDTKIPAFYKYRGKPRE
ncbi:unnamed protein product, partial [marine sediment metagenome]